MQPNSCSGSSFPKAVWSLPPLPPPLSVFLQTMIHGQGLSSLNCDLFPLLPLKSLNSWAETLVTATHLQTNSGDTLSR